MSRKLLFWFGFVLFAIGHFFLVGLMEFNNLVSNQVIAYIIAATGLSFIAISNLLKQNG
ncbi:hypothetical protein [Lentibacillus salinarum]|uniref:Uncharacterized protein n=1 Tax=Lentibacillus salinarum TaxID=446820 RepID=A0ABW3ZSV4_9BACI